MITEHPRAATGYIDKINVMLLSMYLVAGLEDSVCSPEVS